MHLCRGLVLFDSCHVELHGIKGRIWVSFLAEVAVTLVRFTAWWPSSALGSFPCKACFGFIHWTVWQKITREKKQPVSTWASPNTSHVIILPGSFPLLEILKLVLSWVVLKLVALLQSFYGATMNEGLLGPSGQSRGFSLTNPSMAVC